MSQAPPARFLLLLSLCTAWVTSCSGGGSGGEPATSVLFADEFDGPRLAAHWVPSDTTAVDLAAGTLRIRDDGRRNTITLSSWSFASANLGVAVRVARDGSLFGCQVGLPIMTPVVALLDAETGDYVAGVMLIPCSASTPALLRYWVGDPSVDFVEEELPTGPGPEDFMELAFRIQTDRTGIWARDGVDRFDARFGETCRIALLLSSGQGVPPVSMRFDSVVVAGIPD